MLELLTFFVFAPAGAVALLTIADTIREAR